MACSNSLEWTDCQLPLRLMSIVHLTDDNSRVKLIPEEDVGEGDCSDYINASFMPVTNLPFFFSALH